MSLRRTGCALFPPPPSELIVTVSASISSPVGDIHSVQVVVHLAPLAFQMSPGLSPFATWPAPLGPMWWICALNAASIGRHLGIGAEAVEGGHNGSEVGNAAIDHGNFLWARLLCASRNRGCARHNTPLVEGISFPSRRNASRNARPVALKLASTM